MIWVVTSTKLDLTTLLTPHGGHLQLVSRGVYKVLLELFGLDYLPYRILTAAMVCVTVGLLFKYLLSRVPPAIALAPCIVLLFFGSDPLHALQGNGFTVLLAMSTGIAALLAFEKSSKAGDVVAMAALTLGIFTYSVALPFVVAIAVAAISRREARKRIWVALVPALIYGVWLIWAKASGVGGTGSSAEVSHLLLIPAWCFQAISAVASALTGISFDFAGGSTNLAVYMGAPLAILATGGIALSLIKKKFSTSLLTTAIVGLCLWGMQALVSHGGSDISARLPDDARYMFPGAIVLAMLLADAVQKVSWTRQSLTLVAVMAAAGLGTNCFLLTHAGSEFRAQASDYERTAAIDQLITESLNAEDPSAVRRSTDADPNFLAQTPGAILIGMTDLPYGNYVRTKLAPEELSEQERESVDRVLSTEIATERISSRRSASTCRWVGRREVLPFDQSTTIFSSANTDLWAGRLAARGTVLLSSAGVREPIVVQVNAKQRLANPWYVETGVGRLAVCAK